MAWLPDTNVWIQVLKQPGGILEQKLLRQRWVRSSCVRSSKRNSNTEHTSTDGRIGDWRPWKSCSPLSSLFHLMTMPRGTMPTSVMNSKLPAA